MIVKIGSLKFEHIDPTGFWVDFNEIVVDHQVLGDKLSATFTIGPVSITFDHKELEGMYQVQKRYKK